VAERRNGSVFFAKSAIISGAVLLSRHLFLIAASDTLVQYA